MAEELIGETQVVVEGQEGDPLQPHHDDLQRQGQKRGGARKGRGQGKSKSAEGLIRARESWDQAFKGWGS